MQNLTRQDRNPVSIVRRQKAIDEWAEKIKKEGENGMMLSPDKSILMIKYDNGLHINNRLGMIVLDQEPVKEYILRDYGLEGVRTVSVHIQDEMIKVKRAGSYGKTPDNSELQSLPDIIKSFLPEVTGYDAPFSGMFSSNSDYNPMNP